MICFSYFLFFLRCLKYFENIESNHFQQLLRIAVYSQTDYGMRGVTFSHDSGDEVTEWILERR
jgi:hypothetical protein